MWAAIMIDKPVFLAVNPSAQVGEKYEVYIGVFDDPEQIHLPGFESLWHAWAFCICNGLDDPLPKTESNQRWKLNPPSPNPTQMKLFIDKSDEG